jgi:hypothetical protein
MDWQPTDLAREGRLRAIDDRVRMALAGADTDRLMLMLTGDIPCAEMENGTMAETKQMAIRMDLDIIARLDQVVSRLEERTPGLKVSRADAVRVMLVRGMDAFEAETSDKEAGNG